MAPCSLPLRTWGSPGDPCQGAEPLPHGGHGVSPPPSTVPCPRGGYPGCSPAPHSRPGAWWSISRCRFPARSTSGDKEGGGQGGGRDHSLQPLLCPRAQSTPGVGRAARPSRVTVPALPCYLVPALQGPFSLLEQVALAPLQLLPRAAQRPWLLHHLPALRALWGWDSVCAWGGCLGTRALPTSSPGTDTWHPPPRG